MHYRFICPDVSSVEEFRHQMYGNYDDLGVNEPFKWYKKVTKWCSNNFGSEGKYWKVILYEDYYDDDEDADYYDNDEETEFVFVFKNKEDALKFKLTWG